MKKTIIFFSLLISIAASAQSVKELELERKTTLQQLEMTGKLLNETKQNEKSTINKLNIIHRDIATRKRLISSINTEIVALNNEMSSLNRKKVDLEKELATLKDDYAKLVQESYYTHSKYNALLFVLSADSFNKMFRRMRYLQEFANYRKEQVKQIETIQGEIDSKNDTLNKNKRNKQDALTTKHREQENLARSERKEKIMLSDLKKKEKQLLTQQQQQQKKASELNQLIERMIAEEIRKAQEKEGKGQSVPKTPSQQADEKVKIVLTGNFEKNQGKLPWPVTSGFVSGKYGIQPHAVLKNITINNKGIYIQTPANSDAQAVFEGEVTQCFSVQGGASAIIIRHGNYRTVYANLSKIYVKEGDKVTLSETIGKIAIDDKNDNKSELYFQIWKDKTILNPSYWIIKK